MDLSLLNSCSSSKHPLVSAALLINNEIKDISVHKQWRRIKDCCFLVASRFCNSEEEVMKIEKYAQFYKSCIRGFWYIHIAYCIEYEIPMKTCFFNNTEYIKLFERVLSEECFRRGETNLICYYLKNQFSLPIKISEQSIENILTYILEIPGDFELPDALTNSFIERYYKEHFLGNVLRHHNCNEVVKCLNDDSFIGKLELNTISSFIDRYYGDGMGGLLNDLSIESIVGMLIRLPIPKKLSSDLVLPFLKNLCDDSYLPGLLSVYGVEKIVNRLNALSIQKKLSSDLVLPFLNKFCDDSYLTGIISKHGAGTILTHLTQFPNQKKISSELVLSFLNTLGDDSYLPGLLSTHGVEKIVAQLIRLSIQKKLSSDLILPFLNKFSDDSYLPDLLSIHGVEKIVAQLIRLSIQKKLSSDLILPFLNKFSDDSYLPDLLSTHGVEKIVTLLNSLSFPRKLTSKQVLPFLNNLCDSSCLPGIISIYGAATIVSILNESTKLEQLSDNDVTTFLAKYKPSFLINNIDEDRLMTILSNKLSKSCTISTQSKNTHFISIPHENGPVQETTNSVAADYISFSNQNMGEEEFLQKHSRSSVPNKLLITLLVFNIFIAILIYALEDHSEILKYAAPLLTILIILVSFIPCNCSRLNDYRNFQ